jgi:hypothetical protein
MIPNHAGRSYNEAPRDWILSHEMYGELRTIDECLEADIST